MMDIQGLTDRNEGQFMSLEESQVPRSDGSPEAAPTAQAIWLDCWRAAYAPGVGERVAGTLLMRRTLGAGPVALRLFGSPTNLQTPRHSVALDLEPGEAGLGTALIRHRAAGVQLDYLPQADLAVIERQLAGTGYRYLAIRQAAVPVTDCRTGFDQFIARRSKRERQRSRRLLRLADPSHGSLRFSLVTGTDRLDEQIEQCLALEQAGWKGRERSAILDDARDARFYRTLARALAEAGRLRLALLHDSEGQLVAYELCMLWDDRLIALKTSCSERHLDLSPGHVLALLHIRHCCDDPDIAVYDVTGNGLSPAAHLLRYADGQEWLWRLILFAPGWRGWCLRRVWRARLRLRSVKRFLAYPSR